MNPITNLIIIVCLCLTTTVGEYEVPKPIIEVLSSSGLKVSIPDDKGIHLFAFHGNINKPMYGLEAGQFSKDILHKEDGRWVFYDKNARLVDGDVIYYWLFVIRNGFGYRYDDGVYHVKSSSNQIQPLPTPANSEDVLKNRTIAAAPQPHCSSEESKISCIKALTNVTQAISILRDELGALKEENGLLKDIAQKSMTAAVVLKFEGILPEEEPRFVAHNIIKNTLLVQASVVKANRLPNKSIVFEVGNLNEKLAVIKAAKEKLTHSNIILVY